MSNFRLYQAALTDRTFFLRLYDAEIKAVTSRFRLYDVSMTKAEVAAPTPITPVNAESLSTVTIAATHPGSVDTWNFSADPGNAYVVSLTGTGASRNFRAPATLNGVTLKFWVSVTINGVISPAQMITVTVNAHAIWVKQASGFDSTGGWAPYLIQIIS